MQANQADPQSPCLKNLIDQVQNLEHILNDISDDQSSDKDVVLVLGNTGSGKSALITYALGYDLVAEENDVGDFILSASAQPNANIPIIGHGAKSHSQSPLKYVDHLLGLSRL